MNCVNRYGAEQFCAWVGGRLPTEEEWYAAASNGGQWLYPWGDLDASCSTCIMDDASARGSGGGETAGCGEDRTWQVCSRRAGNSISGLCDMAGGLSEWTSTWKDSSQNAGGVRGGSWTDVGPDGQRASSRNWLEPAGAWGSVGFRCVRPSPAVPNKTGVASPPRAGAAEQAADEMVLIPAETFTMGCNRRVDVQCSDDEKPYHQVEIETYYIDRHEVTLRAYSRCVEAGVCDPTTPDPFTQGILAPELPVVSVNLRMARRYCRWNGQRLPTEAEWQRAARGSRLQAYPWGESVAAGSHSLANLGDRTGGLRIGSSGGHRPIPGTGASLRAGRRPQPLRAV